MVERFGVLAAAAGVAIASGEASAIHSSGLLLDFADLVGADRFYAEGYTGSRAVVANIEGGLAWTGHDTLTHVRTLTPVGGSATEFDSHPTHTTHVIGGRGPTFLQRGIAHGAEVWSGGVATAFPGAPGSGGWTWTASSVGATYASAALTGVDGRTADVIGSSWGFEANDGNGFLAVGLDALVRRSGSTLVASAGNFGPSGNTVHSPGAAFNTITVGALDGELDATPYNRVASFSSRGPNDYFDPISQSVTARVRPSVDLVAPGTSFTLALYGGTTGTNTGGVDTTGGSTSAYRAGNAGTSFAAPLVAAGATLLADVGYDRFGGGASIDARVVKSVLMTSARKIPGWSNGTFLDGSGVARTFQALDWSAGAGALDLDRAFDQFTSGTTDVAGASGGVVETIGWDLAAVTEGATTDYTLGEQLLEGGVLTATLNWLVDTEWDALDGAGDAWRHVRHDDLDLELWRLHDDAPAELVAISAGAHDVVEHLHVPIPATGAYELRVRWIGELYDFAGDPNQTPFALSWSAVAVPGPGGAAILAMAVFARRRRR